MRRIFLLIVMLLSLPAFAQPVARGVPKANLTLLADEQLLVPLARIARLYALESKTPLTVVVKNAGDAEQQIGQGLEAHGMITANAALLQRLAEQGLMDVSSRRPVARTQLALVTTSNLDQQADIAKRISFASILAATPRLPVFTSDATTLEGQLAAQLLKEQGFSAELAPRFSAKSSHEELLAALHDEPSLGLMLAAEAVADSDIRVLSLLPEEISPPVTFEVVVLASESMADTRAFANFLLSRQAQKIFSQLGYQAVVK